MDDQAIILSKAWSKCQKQIHSWMHWHAHRSDTRAATRALVRLLNGLLEPKSHTSQLSEIYAKTYWQTRVKDSVPARSNIATIWRSIDEALQKEPKEVIDKLKLEQAKQRALLQKSITKDDDVESDPLIVRWNIQELGPTLHRILEHLSKKTGWSFSLIMGRPDPISPEEGNHITSLHIGADQQGRDFSDVYGKFDTDFVEAYGTFLKRVHGSKYQFSSP
ncbi:hypothetical protein JVU11DRAFT_2206 [Chiua virens]|nr:hypothetical protein JVU11DRAFT_2206 [Chiua virens]